MTAADLISDVYISNIKKGKNTRWHFSLNMPNVFCKFADNQIHWGPGITKAIRRGPAPKQRFYKSRNKKLKLYIN